MAGADSVLLLTLLLFAGGCHSSLSSGGSGSGADLTPLSVAASDAESPSEPLRPQQFQSGAFLTSTAAGPRVLVYEGNLAALAALGDPEGLARAQDWMEWYFGHLNLTPDRLGLRGTIHDHRLGEDGAEVSLGECESMDAAAATFLTLARACFEAQDEAVQRYVREHKYALELIGGLLLRQGRRPAGAEVARGLRDLAWLLSHAFGDSTGAAFYGGRAAATGAGPGPASRSGADPRRP